MNYSDKEKESVIMVAKILFILHRLLPIFWSWGLLKLEFRWFYEDVLWKLGVQIDSHGQIKEGWQNKEAKTWIGYFNCGDEWKINWTRYNEEKLIP